MAANGTKIAIVGMAFRLPDNTNTEHEFWELLRNGRDAVGTLGQDRWATDSYYHPKRAEPGRSVTLSAGLLSKVDEFDAAFFGISPREARQLDPQQRLLLELSWEALENGGQVPSHLSGSDCAVYVGISSTDYGLRPLDDLSVIDAYSITGNTLSLAANRISYFFNLHGPSMAVDTACSSSLVALHQACRGLRDGESAAAIVAGVNMLLHPYPFVGFSKASMLSDRGRCRAFDASGDGYVRAEGGAVLFLKPLDQAEADGDPIHAVILATGTNSDGGRKSGITIPSRAGQAELLVKTCRQAGVKPQDVSYVEAHGTGTMVGDPIEAAAIGEVFGKGRSHGHPLYIGSVKTNLGHLEPASGMAGLLKTVLCLKHRALPPSLHLQSPNPNIDFTGLNLRLVTEYLPLKAGRKPLRMGVNSFGFGGANAHVLLEEYRPRTPALGCKAKAAVVPPLFLSAKTSQALKDLAGRYRDLLRHGDAPDYYDVAYGAAYRRQQLAKRLAVFAASKGEIIERLQLFTEAETASGLVVEDALPGAPRLAFVYSGNGAQWLGMGRRLLEEEPLFRDAMVELQALLEPRCGFSLLGELQADSEASRMHLTEIAQPLLFALQVAVTRVVRAHGLQADAYVGHSVGEVAAAWATGALSLEQAVAVICERSAAQGMTKGCGRMAAIGLSHEQALQLLAEAGLEEDLEVAGINSPNSVTLSGALQALEAVGAIMASRGGYYRLLDLDYAFHSRWMESIRARVLQDLAFLSPSAGTSTFVSTVTGTVLSGDRLDAGYWWDNIRQPVRFADALNTLIDQGPCVFLEIGPHAIMQRYIRECLSARDATGRPVATLRRDDDGRSRLLEAIYRCQLLGCPTDRGKAFPVVAPHVPLPNYPWQRERHWFTCTSEGYDLINRRKVHPLLGYRLKDAEASWEGHLDPISLPYLADHVVGGAVVFPASGFVEMALAAAAQMHDSRAIEFEELEIHAPMVFDGEHGRTVRFELAPQDGAFRISSRQRLSNDPWTLHVLGRLTGEPLGRRPACLEVAALPPGTGPVIDGAEHYAIAHRLGLEYGPAFQGLTQAWPLPEHVLIAKLAAPEAIVDGMADHLLHPAMLDCCFQTLAALFQEDMAGRQDVTLLPVRVGRMRYYGPVEGVVYCRTCLVRHSPHSVVANFQLLDAAGNTLAQLDSCRFRGTSLATQKRTAPPLWEQVARLKPRIGADESSPIAPCQDLARQAMATLVAGQSLQRDNHFQQALPLFDALVGAFAYEALQQLAAEDSAGTQRLLQAVQAADRHSHPMARWLLGVLEEEGYVQRQGESWSLVRGETPPLPEDIWLSIFGDYPNYLPDLVLAARVGRLLPQLLAGADDLQASEASQQASSLVNQMFETSPTYQGTNLLVEALVQAVSNLWPDKRPLRILETGTLGLVRLLLPLLPPGRCDYVLADSDAEHCARLEVEFAEQPWVNVAALDADAWSIEGESMAAATFDIVIINHQLHLAADPVAALQAVKGLLARGGLLVLLERHADRVADLIFGLDERWWRYTEKRPEPVSSLRSPGTWKALLKQTGFAEVVPLLAPAAGDLAAGAFAMLAKNPDAHQPAVQLAADAPSASWLVLTDRQGASRDLAERLRTHLLSRGQRVALAVPRRAFSEIEAMTYGVDVHAPQGIATLLEEMSKQLGGCDHIVHLLGLAAGEEPADLNPMPVQELRCLSTLHLLQSLERSAAPAPPRLWLVTAGGALFSAPAGAVSASLVRPSQAPLWGFGRVIMNEYPELRCTLVDLPVESIDGDAAAWLQTELLAPDGEEEIVYRSGIRHVLRMQRFTETPRNREGSASPAVSLGFTTPGRLNNLQWQTMQTRMPAAGEIEIQPVAVGLNFRDVMYAMGLLSDEAVENGFAGPTLGMEVAGVVTRVGRRVSGFQVGDPVLTFAPACFASRVYTRADSAMRKPQQWSFEEAATVPTVFFTVYYALHHLARLQAGERVLIHGAAGGVGIAAIQVARYLGAEIFATAGSQEKWDFVRMIGADHVMNSRSLAYADDILEATGGQGVDVVLNSLAGEAINRNLRILRPFGRFLELGKRDYYENTKIGLRPFKDNITYYGIDADQLMVERPALADKLFREVMELFQEGVLRPLPYRAFPVARVIDAFRYMQQSKQIGKVVVTFAAAAMPVPNQQHTLKKPVLSREATYLVSGGLAGFGLKTVQWLVGLGAGHVVLLSRRGADTPGAAEAIAALEAQGAQVHVKRCDVTDEHGLNEVLAEIARDLPPLRGVLHAAMVLDDGFIRNLDGDRFQTVMRPKVLGAWHLHRLTLALPLDFFVLYSSATTAVGNPGQANYVAANIYLEALAAYRRCKGLPATCVAWGAIDDVGYLARNETVKDALQSRLGGAALKSDEALEQLGDMMARQHSGLAAIDFDWPTLSRYLPAARGLRYHELRRFGGSSTASAHQEMDIRELIADRSRDEVVEIVRMLVTQEVAQILRLPPDRIETERSLYDLGMDSLMGVELVLGIEKRFGVSLPVMALSEGPTIRRVAERIAHHLTEGHEEAATAQDDALKAVVNAMAAQHAEAYSEEDIEVAVDAMRQQVAGGARLIP